MARGSIVKRKLKKPRNGSNHTYTIVYYVGTSQKWEAVGPNRKEAEKVLAQRLSEINNGTYHRTSEIIFNDFIDKWLDEYAAPRIKPNTLYKYKNSINCHVRPTLGKFYTSKISANDIRSLMSKMIKFRSPKTVNNILTMLKTIFKYARRWGYIQVSPAEDIDKFRVEHQEMDFLKPQEIVVLLSHCHEPFKTLLQTAVLTGMRKGELLGLQWGDIDWNSNTIFVRRSLKWRSAKDTKEGQCKWYFDSPKTRYSVRAVTMSPRLQEALEIHRINASINEWDLIFTNSEGKPLDPDNLVKREFQPALRLAGLRQIRWHDLRHSYTSLLIAQGENIKFIQSQLGHASIQTTMDRYGHLLPVDRVGVGNRLDRLVYESEQNQVHYLKVKEPAKV